MIVLIREKPQSKEINMYGADGKLRTSIHRSKKITALTRNAVKGIECVLKSERCFIDFDNVFLGKRSKGTL